MAPGQLHQLHWSKDNYGGGLDCSDCIRYPERMAEVVAKWPRLPIRHPRCSQQPRLALDEYLYTDGSAEALRVRTGGSSALLKRQCTRLISRQNPSGWSERQGGGGWTYLLGWGTGVPIGGLLGLAEVRGLSLLAVSAHARLSVLGGHLLKDTTSELNRNPSHSELHLWVFILLEGNTSITLCCCGPFAPKDSSE